jgi:iron complex outermembrane recepter protein
MRFVLFTAALLSGISFPALAATAADEPTGDHHQDLSNEIVVTAQSQDRSTLLSGVSVMSGETLAQQQRPSIGETLAKLPGVSASSFGPTASRPILRGLSGDRVRILTDGIGSFDASATSADHAVAVNPLTADRIEVIRGPAALLYGSSAIGGVVNVIDSRIPRHVPDEPVHVQLESGYGSAAKDRSVAGAIDVPIAQHWVAHVDGSFDKTADLDTGGYILSKALRQEAAASSDPEVNEAGALKGRIPNTQSRSWDVAGGIAYIDDRGNIGISVAQHDSLYGVPVRYSLEPGAEDEGPRIDMRQTRVDLRAEVNADGNVLQQIKLRAGYADYRHDELAEDGSIGTSFFNKGMEGRIDLVQAKHGAWSGTTGGQIITRKFYVEGDEKFLPPTQTDQYGLFSLQTLDFGKLKLEAGGRIEHETAKARADETIGNPSERRSFNAYSGSLGASYALVEGVRLGLNLTHTERAPSAEELFSNGPHDGTQSYELSTPGLNKEKSNGAEAVLHVRAGDRFSLDASGYYNRFTNFIYQAPTGEIEDGLPVYLFANGKAKQYGFEVEAQGTVARFGRTDLRVDGQADYVHINVDNYGPAPLTPPLRLLGGVSAHSDAFDIRGEVEHDFRQNRAAPNETETAAFTLVNASIAWRPLRTDRVTLRLQANNIFDVIARRSTSLLKDYAPLAGRDIRVGASFKL